MNIILTFERAEFLKLMAARAFSALDGGFGEYFRRLCDDPFSTTTSFR